MVNGIDFTVQRKAFRGNTKIDTPSGMVRLNTLSDGDWIYAMDEETLELTVQQCTAPSIVLYKAGIRKVSTDNGFIVCGANTYFYTRQGKMVMAMDLVTGDQIISIHRTSDKGIKAKYGVILNVTSKHASYGGSTTEKFQKAFSKVKSISTIVSKEDLWNISVKGDNNVVFINSFAVHNQQVVI